MNNTGIIILAAGNSTRLGRPKQLLPYQDSTLIAHIVTEAVTALLHPIVVVTGAFANEVANVLKGQKIHISHNPCWPDGMGTGIATGLSAIYTLQPDTKAIILAVCDQPHLSAALLQNLISTQAATGKGIVACSYSDTVGTPVLFTHRYFASLSSLSGKEGAKKLLLKYPDDLAQVPFPKGHIDIDTPDDYQTLLSGNN